MPTMQNESEKKNTTAAQNTKKKPDIHTDQMSDVNRYK